jgi:hypothetical protein
MDEKLQINEFKDCNIRLRKIIETTQKAKEKGSVRIRPIFKIKDEDISLLKNEDFLEESGDQL